jgi:type I restriction enzyme M protein
MLQARLIREGLPDTGVGKVICYAVWGKRLMGRQSRARLPKAKLAAVQAKAKRAERSSRSALAKVKPSKAQNSEVDAYVFIKENLKLLGWDTRNPARNPTGQVYTQNECFAHDAMKEALGLDRPENIVKISDSVHWIIEAKRNHKQLEQAVSEAEDYAAKINGKGIIKAAFISGVAGNLTDSYVIRTKFLVGGKFKPVRFNGKDISSLISPDVAKLVLESGPDINDVPVDEHLFLSKAEKVNQILHLGAINKNDRAKVMAALLLSLVDDTRPNIDATPTVLIKDINTRAEEVLTKHSKAEFYEYVRLSLPAAKDNHIKFKAALVQTIQELENLNIRSAMNSGTDVLGKFYEVFLKYGNGAKEIGIVLTPRQITQFAVDAMSVTERDIIYDPCCGTAGFLIAAFDHVKKNHSVAQINRFKKNNLFGVDQESAVVSLAIVNMIFRGDGKNNIIEANSFAKNLVRKDTASGLTARYRSQPPEPDETVVTRVLMNPPFALRSNDEKEFRFVDHALKQMQTGGLLFAVLPYSALVKSGDYQLWRNRLMTENTLLSVVTLPTDLFYPVSVHTVGMFVLRGTAHPMAQNVLWARAVNDGLLKMKGKRLASPRAKNDLVPLLPSLKAFLLNQQYPVINVLQVQKACPINFDDPLLELVPENYLDEASPTQSEMAAGIEEVMRNSAAYLVRAGRNHG